MAKGTSAAAALRKAEKAKVRNKSVISNVKSRVSNAEKLVKAKDAEAPAAVKAATSSLDKAGKKGVLHRNTVARRKGRLAKKANSINPKAATK
ncbi:MAG: 30S ribosomal protein S20 [Dehalococcoidia bacterium]|nr:30S ribosomal protein S20 [Dehalococcoidia bacterium]